MVQTVSMTQLTDTGVVQVVDITRGRAIFSAGDFVAIQAILSEQGVTAFASTDVVLAIVGGVTVSMLRVTPRGSFQTSVNHWDQNRQL